MNNCLDCNTECHHQAKRCRKCQDKRHSKLMRGSKNIKYIDGRAKEKKCSICKIKMLDYRHSHCQSCENKIRFKGKSYEQLYGKERANKLKQQRSKTFFGIPKSEEHKRKLSLAFGGTGIPYELTKYGSEFSPQVKEEIRLRDRYICQLCNCSQYQNGQKLSVHHIDYDKQNNQKENLISLCITCHRKTNTNRNYWKSLFSTSKVEV